uniref:Uncharacterized protein n=1 Tax=Chlorocebus sabaeus TaxID=60711 RepID=A0A0D9SBX3_CHLSB
FELAWGFLCRTKTSVLKALSVLSDLILMLEERSLTVPN